MSIFQNHAGISLSQSKLQLVEVVYDGEEFTLNNADEEYFDEFLKLDEKETRVLANIQSAFDELIMRTPLQSRYVSFTLPHEFFRVVQLPFDNSLTQHDLHEQFKWELSLLYPGISADELLVQHVQIDDCKKDTPDRAIVVATFRKYLRLLKNFAAQNNLKLKYVDNPHIASDRLIMLDESISKGELILSVYVTGTNLSVAFIIDGSPVYFRIIPVTQAGNIIPALSAELASIKDPDLNQKFISRAYMSGDNISESLLEKAKQALRISFNRINPFEKIDVNPELYNKKAFSERPNSFSPAAAIAYRIV